MNALIKLVVALLVATASTTASASPINFDTLSDLESVTTQYPGLSFSGATVLTAGISLNEYEFPPASWDNVVYDEYGPIEIVFATPMLSVAALFTYATALSAVAFDLIDTVVDTDTSDFLE